MMLFKIVYIGGNLELFEFSNFWNRGFEIRFLVIFCILLFRF